MIRSKDISEYFPAGLQQLKGNVAIPFDLYLYFAQNRHLLVWKAKGETLSAEFIEKYTTRKLDRVWIHRDDKGAFLAYLKEHNLPVPRELEPAAPAAPAKVASPQIETPDLKEPPSTPPEEEVFDLQPIPENPPRTQEGALMAAVMDSPNIPDEAKKAIVAEAAQAVLEEAAQADSARDQVKRNQKVREVVQDVLESTGKEAAALVAEIWKMADVDPDLEHAVNVATYSVIFAMAFGRIDQDLVSDLAMAGLLHDVGVCQVDGGATRNTWTRMSDGQTREYRVHVEGGLDLLARYAPDVPERVRTIISQSHEKFDGSGYPQGLRGFKLDDIAQLLSMAEFVDSVASGQWDGARRTLKEALLIIEGFEKKRSFPEFFNPEVFSEVLRWTKTASDANALGEAALTVGAKTRDLVSGGGKR